MTGHLVSGVQAPMRSRASGPGRLRGDAKVSGRRVTCKAPLAHLVGGSGRSETSPTAILQGTHSLVVEFSEICIQHRAYNAASEPKGSILNAATLDVRLLYVVVLDRYTGS